ncbi:MAG: NAD(P)H-dependent glycerol-3-phosphate dehydrogenase [bacterium]
MGKIAVLGAGMMGTATAAHLARKDHEVNLWGTELDKDIIDALRKGKEHLTLHFPVPRNIRFFQATELAEAMEKRNTVIVAVISSAVGKIIERAAPFFRKGTIVVNVAKGLPSHPYLTLCDLIKDRSSSRLLDGVQILGMGGPARANELIKEIHTEVIFGARKLEEAESCCCAFRSSRFRTNATTDMIGVELCAAMKNAFAIVIGICDGLGQPMDNTKAALMSQAVVEMSRIILPLGGRLETISGPAGVGDLYVTVQSGRNGALGRFLGQGLKIEEALEKMKGQTIEGYTTARGIHRLAKRLEKEGGLDLNRDLPLFKELYAVLYEGKPAPRVINDYWDRHGS